MKKKNPERSHSRVDHMGEVFLEASDNEGRNRNFNGRTVNLSDGGLCVLTDTVIEPGSVLKLKLPFHERDVSIPCFAEVRWVNSAGDGFKVGLQFLI